MEIRSNAFPLLCLMYNVITGQKYQFGWGLLNVTSIFSLRIKAS